MERTNEKICKIFFRRSDFPSFMSKSFQILDHVFPLLFPKDSVSLIFFKHWTFASGDKNTVKKSEKHQNQKNPAPAKFTRKQIMFCAAILHPLLDFMRPLLPNNFPKDSESLKFLDIQLREVGGEGHLNGTSKS